MTNLRSRVRNALRRYNSEYGLSTKVSGSNGKIASLQAANRLEATLPYDHSCSHDTISVRSIPQDTGCNSLLLGRQDHNLGRLKHCSDSLKQVSLSRYTNLTVHNWMDFYIVVNKDGIIEELSSMYAPLAMTDLCSGERLDLTMKPCSTAENLFVWGGDCDFGNYCHFIYDYLPQLSLLRDVHGELYILMPESNKSFHSICEAVFFDQWSQLNLNHGQSIHVNNLFSVYPKAAHPMFRCSWWAVDFLNSAIPADLPADTGEILFITRSRRAVRNEAQLLKTLRSRGLKVDSINFDSFNVHQQIGIINSYTSVIGVHGAGFTNILFGMNKIKKVLEIMPIGCGTPTFAMVAFRLGYQHAILGVDPIITSHPNHPDCLLSKDGIDDIYNFLVS